MTIQGESMSIPQRALRKLARGWDRIESIGLAGHRRRVAAARARFDGGWQTAGVNYQDGLDIAVLHAASVGDKAVVLYPGRPRGRHAVDRAPHWRRAARYARAPLALASWVGRPSEWRYGVTKERRELLTAVAVSVPATAVLAAGIAVSALAW